MTLPEFGRCVGSKYWKFDREVELRTVGARFLQYIFIVDSSGSRDIEGRRLG
jgi:hypothetical protein